MKPHVAVVINLLEDINELFRQVASEAELADKQGQGHIELPGAVLAAARVAQYAAHAALEVSKAHDNK